MASQNPPVNVIAPSNNNNANPPPVNSPNSPPISSNNSPGSPLNYRTNKKLATFFKDKEKSSNKYKAVLSYTGTYAI